MRMSAGIVLLVLGQGLAACAGSGPSSTPSAPSPIPQSVPQPVPEATPIHLTAVSPNIGATGGSTPVTITGAGFQSGATVTLDGTVLERRKVYVRDSTTIHLSTPAHAAGAVDVVVRNPSGQAETLVRGYTYAVPESFDFNGTWAGGAGSEYETDIRFTIQNNVLTSVSCGTSGNLTLSPQPAVRNGEFSFVGDDGAAMSGRIVSAANAVGTINIASCTSTIWLTTKQ